MGSYPRREKAEQQARERADKVPALDCQSCGALTPGERFRYFADQIICEACDEGIRRAVGAWCRERFSSPAAYA
jgi:formylmethanofuran dehydrogenase subunit E